MKLRKQSWKCGFNTVRIFSDNIEIKFGLQKCATLAMRGGENVESGIAFETG